MAGNPLHYTICSMPNSAARRALQEAIEVEKAEAARRLRRYEEIACKHRASQRPGGTPLCAADLLEWHSFAQQLVGGDKSA
jgi:hypothetical protein